LWVKKKGWILVLAAPVKGKIDEKLEGNYDFFFFSFSLN